MAEVNPASWHDNSGNTYDAIDDRRGALGIITQGGRVESGDLAVTAAGSGLSVSIAAGIAIMPDNANTRGGYYMGYNDAAVTLTPSAAHGSLERHDMVEAKVAAATGTWSLALNQGTPATTPSDPAISTNAISLARLNITAGMTNIASGDIDNLREYAQTPTTELGYAEITSDIGAAAYTATTDLTGLAVSVVAPGDKKVCIEAHTRWSVSTVACPMLVRIYESNTQLAESGAYISTTSYEQAIDVVAYETPSAGEHTYKVVAVRGDSTAGTKIVEATSTAPSFISCILV